jgi:hypothetical protein
MNGERKFPLLGGGSIPRGLAEEAYRDYAKRYGTQQSLEELAKRGGFGPDELDQHLPGWREKASEVSRLQARVAELEEALEGCLTPDAKGVLHEPDCIGLQGYDCKVWCANTRAALSGSSDWLATHDAEVRRAALNEAAKVADARAAALAFDPDGSGIELLEIASRIRALASPSEAVKP